MDENNVSDEDENLTYEQLRAKRIEKKNYEMFNILGVSQVAKTLASCLKKKPHIKNNQPKSASIKPINRSMRIAHLPNPQDRYYSGTSGLSRHKRESDFVEKLSDDLAIKEPINNFHMLPSEKFVHALRSLDMNIPPIKMSGFGIQSLTIHPSETSLILAAGDRKGNISLYDRNSEMYFVHKALVNCISFFTWNPNKFFSTSYDGSVICGDIVKHTFDIISSGHVDMVDTRIPDTIINSAWCHKRSVCRVQCHPLLKNYFLTSSEVGEVSLRDIRNITDKHINPVLRFKHPKELKSSFFLLMRQDGINIY